MIRSLQWRMQVFHAVVLAVVLSIFGAGVDTLLRQMRLQEFDAELDRVHELIGLRMRRLIGWPPGPSPRWPGPGPVPVAGRPPGGPALGNPFAAFEGWSRPFDRNWPDGRGNRNSLRESDGTGPVSATDSVANLATRPDRLPLFDQRNGDGLGDNSRFNDPDRPTPTLAVPEEYLNPPGRSLESRVYFIVWAGNGKVLEKSTDAPDLPYPKLKLGENNLPVRVVQERAGNREIIEVSRFATNVLVGRSLTPMWTEQRRTTWLIALAGTAVLIVGVVGGGWLTRRALRPLHAMSATARTISAQSLGARIDIRGTDAELANLGAVLNQTFDRLQKSFEQQTQFTADASHELRTPIAVLLAQTQLALARPRTSDEYRSALTSCRQAASRMKTLIDQLLHLARNDAPPSDKLNEPVSFNNVVRDCVDLLRPLAEQRKIALTFDADAVTIFGDGEGLSQLANNLIFNAIRYNQPEGQVAVSVRIDPAGGEAVLSVADTGVGIPAESLPFIFDRFFRVDKARSREDGGSGLGLSICKSVVDRHHGLIAVNSAVGQGTTVTVRLPMVSTPNDSAAAQPIARVEAMDALTSNILPSATA